MSDYQGKVYEHIEYTPYGELWVEHGPEGLEAVPYRFTGKELDTETGLYYYGARYLNPRTSRWISADPGLDTYLPVRPVDDEARQRNQNLPGQGGVFMPVNLAVYHYGGNNPLKYKDPTGTQDEEANKPDLRPLLVKVLTAIAEAAEKRWEFPIKTGTLKSAYGKDVDPFRPGKHRFHGGIDIAAPEGTPTYAPQAGTVVQAVEKHPVLGNVVVIQHADGSHSIQAHLKSFSVGAGDEVTKGQQVGTVGSTGKSTGPHLHYGILPAGTPMPNLAGDGDLLPKSFVDPMRVHRRLPPGISIDPEVRKFLGQYYNKY